jgi:hypothetical protein
MFFPAEGDRIVVTRTMKGSTRSTSWVGRATQVMPFHESESGVWIGGWRLTGHNVATGEPEDSHFACSQSLARYNHGVQTVRRATEDD